MTTTHTELYRFTELGTADPFEGNQNFYFILDKSGSMSEAVSPGVTRISILKDQVNAILDVIDANRIKNSVAVHVGICGFSGTTTEIIRRNMVTSDLVDLKAFVNGLTPTWDGTDYNAPLVKAQTYFLTSTPSDYRQSCFFITDGEPNPTSTATDAVNNCGDMINNTGSFTTVSGNNVDIYCISVDVYNTNYLALLDNSARDGVPVVSSTNSNAIYNAVLGAIPTETQIWTYTSGDASVTKDGEVYSPLALGRSEAETKNELSRANLEVRVSLDNTMGKRWLNDLVEVMVGLTIFERDTAGDFYVVWKGRLMGVKPTMSEIVLNFESIFTSLRRPGLRARYQRSCRHMLYGRGCGIDMDTYGLSGTPTAATGNVVTVPEAANQTNGYFNGGIIEGPNATFRYIASHSGSSLTLMRPFDSLAAAIPGGPCRMFPGCNRTRDICDSRFDNIANYGGFDWIPTRNPMDGSSII